MPKRYDTTQDKNFDDLVHRFSRNIYGQLKGKIRLAIINRDLEAHLDTPKSILDVGGGQGQLAIEFAKQGHSVTLCDVSEKMIELAKQAAAQEHVSSINFIHSPLQSLPEQDHPPADIVLCHAVLEWMAKPEEAFPILHNCLPQGGILSLAFFNVDSLIYKNLVRANYRKALSNDYVGVQGSLTPINPLKIDQVKTWCEQYGFTILDYSGIRTFHDYIADKTVRARHPEAAIEAELQFSKQDPFRQLGRYIHIVAQKN